MDHRHGFKSRKQLVERSRFACPMEIEGPGAKAQARERGVVIVGRGSLDRLGTNGGCGSGLEMRRDLDRGRTEAKDLSRTTGGPDGGTRIEAHHDDTGTGGGRGRSAAQGMGPWSRRMVPFSQLGHRKTPGS